MDIVETACLDHIPIPLKQHKARSSAATAIPGVVVVAQADDLNMVSYAKRNLRLMPLDEYHCPNELGATGICPSIFLNVIDDHRERGCRAALFRRI
ncbi:MAG: hypothetical protein ABJM90_14245 [Paracoccaceae bacterium]